MTSTSGRLSRAWATRAPQNVDKPVIRTRRPMSLPEPDATALTKHVPERLLQLLADRLRLFHDAALRVPLLVRRNVERNGVEDLELELGREVGKRPEQGSEQQVVSGNGEVRQVERARERRRLVEDRHRFLGADDGDRHDGDAGPHRNLDEAAPAEPAQLVAIAVDLARPLAALGEDQHELLLLAQ